MKIVRFQYLLVLFLIFTLSVSAQNNLFQYSVIPSLMEGNYEGDLSFAELAEHGNFGLGTLNMLDGEMVLLDGIFYQVRSNGKVNIIPASSNTPFAVVTSFETDKSITTGSDYSLKDLTAFIDKEIASNNFIYAIRVEGKFDYVKTRSVPAQQKPFKKLVEVTKNQPVFEFNNIEGTLVGFRFPSFSDGVNVPGYHFHFISKDKKSGGHLLDVKTSEIKIDLDQQETFTIDFPSNDEFKKIDLSKRDPDALNKAEK